MYACTRFDKTRFPHTSNSSISISCNLTSNHAIDLEFSHNHMTVHKTAGENLKLMVYLWLELWIFELVKVDVCESLVLSNSVTKWDFLPVINFQCGSYSICLVILSAIFATWKSQEQTLVVWWGNRVLHQT